MRKLLRAAVWKGGVGWRERERIKRDASERETSQFTLVETRPCRLTQFRELQEVAAGNLKYLLLSFY